MTEYILADGPGEKQRGRPVIFCFEEKCTCDCMAEPSAIGYLSENGLKDILGIQLLNKWAQGTQGSSCLLK